LECNKLKYRNVTDAAETVLGFFGFDSTPFGKSKDKWWMELRRNRINDVKAETNVK
jgi:hypothetical protein